MDLISQHIAYLLLTCRKVDVPAMGTFKARKDSAWFNSEDGVFYPSRTRITFQLNVKNECPQLVKSLCRKFNISEKEANVMIVDYVDKILKCISKNKYCRLSGLGYLFQNNGKILFHDTFWKHNRLSNISSVKII